MIQSYLTPGNWGTVKPGSVADSIVKNWQDFQTEKPVSKDTYCGIGMLGLADDLGVKLNKGRVGAAEGPDAFRKSLASYGSAQSLPFAEKKLCIVDFGNVIPSRELKTDEENLLETHRQISEIVKTILERGLFPFGIGGGHDLTFPFVRAVSDFFEKSLDGFYFDAHLDVRPTNGSGMPFRKLLEGDFAASMTVAGLDEFSNTKEHLDWFLTNGGKTAEFDEVNVGAFDFASLDLDVVDSAFAPGVSAKNPNGLAPKELAELVHQFGKSKKLKCFDMMEFCPRFDIDDRTGRLCAHLFLKFLKGWVSSHE